METMLLVEDDRMLRKCLQFSLHKEGWEVTGAGSVEEALGKLLQRDFDLIVTDYQLSSGRDGLSLLAHVKKDEAGPPVILMSGSRTIGLEARARERGAAAFVRKPFDLERFLGACRSVLMQKRENRKETA